MSSSDKFRLLAFVFFLALLIIFGMLYKPVDASSHPAYPPSFLMMPIGNPLQIRAPLGLPPLPIP
jgi:hypothetical protein